MAEPVVMDPTYFVGAGVNPLQNQNATAVQNMIRHFTKWDLSPLDTPWVMIEFIVEVDSPQELDEISLSIAAQMGLSKVFIPAPPYADIKTDSAFIHHFRVGMDIEQSLIIGAATEKFYEGWLNHGQCYLEVHLWLVNKANKAQDVSKFLWTIIKSDETSAIVFTEQVPMLCPVDVDRGYVCRWAKKKLAAAGLDVPGGGS